MCSAAFVELFLDNLALLKQLESMQSTKQASKANLREVRSVSTWLYCFLAYVYMAAATPDACSREILTYARLILRTGGDGWTTYNRLFREYAALDKSKRLDWTTLDPGLHQATFMQQASYGGKMCSHCLETDHADHKCALASVKNQGSDCGPSPCHRRRATIPTQVLAAPRDPGEHLYQSSCSAHCTCVNTHANLLLFVS